MIRHRQYYDIYPKVVQTGVPTDITLAAKNKAKAFTCEAYYIAFIPAGHQNIGFCRQWPEIDQLLVQPEHGALKFTYTFAQEQEYHIWVYAATEADRGKSRKENILEIKTVTEQRVYALDADLYCRRPMVGDLHLHSSGSDGQEAPDFIAAQYRKAGYDFLSISDHHTMEPSIKLVEQFKDLEMGLTLYPAEEVHPPENAIHMLNFGGDYSVNAIFDDEPERYRKEVEQLQTWMEPTLTDDLHAYRLCSCIWSAEQIRKAGGLAVLSHPMERWPLQYVSEEMLDWFLEHNIFDAMDVAVFRPDAMLRQLARWNDARAKGWNIAITGIDDCHGSVISKSFMSGKTIVFAAENSRDGIVSAIKDGYNVVTHTVQGETPHVYGTYRFVDYAQFLLEEYFPLHDEVAFCEGVRIHDHNNGDPTAAEDIARISRRAKALEEKYFGK